MTLGLRPDGEKEIIDYRLAVTESAAEWEQFLTDLFRRGLEGRRLEMIGVDGGASLMAALPVVHPGIPVQRCWAHKADHAKAKAGLHAVTNAASAWSGAEPAPWASSRTEPLWTAPFHRLHPRKRNPGTAYPLLPDTEQLTLPTTGLRSCLDSKTPWHEDRTLGETIRWSRSVDRKWRLQREEKGS